MGFWLWKYFRSLKSFATDAQTEVFPLPKRGMISNLLLEIQALSGTANIDNFLANVLTKVEVIGNGSTVIQSLDGRQIQASAAYDDGKMPPDKEMSPSGTCFGYFDIRFGRYPGDELYALDCSKWDSLELKITYDMNATGTMTSTGFATTTGKLSITGLYSPDGAGLSPVGYLKKEEKRVYASAAGGTEDLPLPSDYPFRRLLLFAETKLKWPYRAFQYVTININSGARRPIDNMLGNDLMIFDLAMRGNPLWYHWKRYYLAANHNTISPPIRWAADGSVGYIGGGATVVLTSFDPNHIRATASAATTASIGVRGYAPWGALAIDLEAQTKKHGLEAMMDAWGFDQTADIHFEHTQQEAGIAESIVLEQYATQP
ncbi:hypothetical protein ES708_21793 [subsurface metagenome]